MWLNDRLARAYTAALVLEAAPNGMVSDSARQANPRFDRRPRRRHEDGQAAPLLAVDDMPPPINDDFDMRNVKTFDSIVDAFKLLLDEHTPAAR